MAFKTEKLMDFARETFLTELARTGIVGNAAAAAGVDRSTTWRWRKDPAFEELVVAALEEAADRIEAEARRRAVEGVDVPVIHKGMPTYLYELDERGLPRLDENNRPILRLDANGQPMVLTTKSYSDGLLVKLLGAFKPERYRENSRMELTGANGGPVDLTDTQAAAKLAGILAAVKARKHAAAGAETGLFGDDGSDLV